MDAPGMLKGPLTIGVIGTGTMGTGIARLFFRAGHDIRVFDRRKGWAADWLHTLPEAERQAPDGRRITDCGSAAEAVTGVDLVVEAVAEDVEVKQALLREISAQAPPAAVIATNTSSFPIDKLAPHCVNPERLLGVHFFNPADVIPGVEVIPGPATAPDVVTQVRVWLVDAGKRPAVVQSSPAFIANRLQMTLFLECLRCVEEGLVSAADLDTVVSTTFGFRLALFGPFAIADMAGLDIYQGILQTLEAKYGERFATPAALSERTGRGEFGLKTGTGFWSYSDQARSALPAARDDAYLRLRDALEALVPEGLLAGRTGGLS